MKQKVLDPKKAKEMIKLKQKELELQIQQEQQKLQEEIAKLEDHLQHVTDVKLEERVFAKLSFTEFSFSLEDALELIHEQVIRFKLSYINILSSCIAITKRENFIVTERRKEMVEFNSIPREN